MGAPNCRFEIIHAAMMESDNTLSVSEAVFAPDRGVDGCRRQHRERGLGVITPGPLALFHFLFNSSRQTGIYSASI